MGDTFGAWIVTVPNTNPNITEPTVDHVVVCKAYAAAQGIAKQRWPDYKYISLACSKAWMGGEVVIQEDDGTVRDR